ncbi:hypothetical protein [Absidia glauca]|uniref:Uncharacterized protein n=1 Tax=Absidia glauca TaxID=4829 RepID=A0A168NGX5_ABSGL|nr:hypothetical protein [Absidia glauca]
MKYDGTTRAEICSNESPTAIIKQQCKNLRINTAILSALKKKVWHGHGFQKLMAMDWVGNHIGHLYMLEKLDNVFVSSFVHTTVNPKEAVHLAQMKSTLNYVFVFERGTRRYLRIQHDSGTAISLGGYDRSELELASILATSFVIEGRTERRELATPDMGLGFWFQAWLGQLSTLFSFSEDAIESFEKANPTSYLVDMTVELSSIRKHSIVMKKVQKTNAFLDSLLQDYGEQTPRIHPTQSLKVGRIKNHGNQVFGEQHYQQQPPPPQQLHVVSAK